LAWEDTFRLEDGTLDPPPMPMDREALWRDFFPFERRRLQRTGVQFKRSRYWHASLASLIHPDRQVTLHYDPDDLSRIWIRDDDDTLIEAVAIAGRAKGEATRFALSSDEQARLDGMLLEGYERTDGIQKAAETRRRQSRQIGATSPARGKRGGRRNGAPKKRVTNDTPFVPLDRKSITVEVLS
jgi:putative transposase